jgi:hypothetical protein
MAMMGFCNQESATVQCEVGNLQYLRMQKGLSKSSCWQSTAVESDDVQFFERATAMAVIQAAPIAMIALVFMIVSSTRGRTQDQSRWWIREVRAMP